MNNNTDKENKDIVNRGKTIRNLIKELLSFEDLDMEVRISINGGDTHKNIGLVGKVGGKCVLINFDEQETIEQ